MRSCMVSSSSSEATKVHLFSHEGILMSLGEHNPEIKKLLKPRIKQYTVQGKTMKEYL